MGKRVMQYRRKREGRTDYKKRLLLLKSDMPRIVIRRSNKSVQAQLISYAPDGDKVLATVRATDLKKLGWKRNTGNIPAAYLTGILLAERAKKHLAGDAILDIGLQKHQKGSRIYAVAKGALDAGLKVRCSEEVFPQDARLMGEHVDRAVPGEIADMKIKIMSVKNG